MITEEMGYYKQLAAIVVEEIGYDHKAITSPDDDLPKDYEGLPADEVIFLQKLAGNY